MLFYVVYAIKEIYQAFEYCKNVIFIYVDV